MAENNQNRFNQQDDWNQDRNRTSRDSNYQSENYGSFGNTGYDDDIRHQRSSGNSYGQSSYGQGSSYGQNDDRFRNSGYGQQGNQQYGSSYGSGYDQNDMGRHQQSSGSQYQQGSSYGQYGNTGYGSQSRDNDWNSYDNRRSQQYGQQQSNRGGSQDFYGNSNFGNSGQSYGQSYRSGQSYGGSNYGSQGGSYNRDRDDRSWWEKTKDQVSSWFDSDDNNRNRYDSRQRMSGGHRGKGPKEYQRSSDRIREDIYDRLSDDDHIDATNISAQVTGNEVILTGTVSSREEKRHAEDLVESISGVRHVENRIRVASSSDRSSMYQNVSGSTGSSASRTEGMGSREYTGNTDNPGGIGNESGTTNEIIRNANKDKK